MTWRVLALPPLPTAALAAFAPDGAELVDLPDRSPEAFRTALADAEIVIGDWSYQLRMDAEMLRAAPHLAVVQHPSVGYDSTDLTVATDLGIPVANTPGANARSVAEWVVMTTLMLRRRLPRNDAMMAAGQWPQSGLGIREVGGARIGILGMGAIGVLVAEMLTALGAEVSYWSRHRKELPYDFQALPDLAAGSDVLVSLLPGGDETRHLVDADLLGRLPRTGYLVSAGRGSVVDEVALVAALRDRVIAGAALDVFEVEPLPADSPLRDLPDVVLTSHNAGASGEAGLAIMAAARANVARVVAGEPLLDVVNGVAPIAQRR